MLDIKLNDLYLPGIEVDEILAFNKQIEILAKKLSRTNKILKKH